MKIRNGFVSNSSSSSFVIIIPNNFDIDGALAKGIPELINMGYLEEEISFDKIKKELLDSIAKYSSIYYEDNYAVFNIAEHIFKEYSIASFDTGPDGGQIAFIKQSSIEEQLAKLKKEEKK